MHGVEVGDIDSDGDLDVAVVAGLNYAPEDSEEVFWHANDGAGDFSAVQSIDMGASVRSVALVDLDLDGRTDIATVGRPWGGGFCTLAVRLGVPGGFAPPTHVSAPNFSGELAARDLDGDGLPELVIVGAGAFNVSVYRNLGGGAFATPVKYDYEARSDAGTASPRFADVDGDGAEDLVFGSRDMRVVVAFGDGAGGFTRAENYSAPGLVGELGDLVAADLDGDGDVDVLAVGSDSIAGTVLHNLGVSDALVYCAQAPNSLGCQATIDVVGVARASGLGACTIGASDVVSNRNGTLFYGYRAQALPTNLGRLCVGAPLRRTPVQNSGGASGALDCSGSFAFDLNAHIASGVDPALIAGEMLFAQYYFRDPSAPAGAGYSSAVEIRIAP